MSADPARTTIARAVAAADERVAMATNALVRAICGAVPWYGDVAKRHRGELAQALTDRDVAKNALALLDEIDAKAAKKS